MGAEGKGEGREMNDPARKNSSVKNGHQSLTMP